MDRLLGALFALMLLTGLWPGIAYAQVAQVPEPSSLILVAAGGGALAWWLSRRR